MKGVFLISLFCLMLHSTAGKTIAKQLSEDLRVYEEPADTIEDKNKEIYDQLDNIATDLEVLKEEIARKRAEDVADAKANAGIETVPEQDKASAKKEDDEDLKNLNQDAKETKKEARKETKKEVKKEAKKETKKETKEPAKKTTQKDDIAKGLEEMIKESKKEAEKEKLKEEALMKDMKDAKAKDKQEEQFADENDDALKNYENFMKETSTEESDAEEEKAEIKAINDLKVEDEKKDEKFNKKKEILMDAMKKLSRNIDAISKALLELKKEA